MDKRGMLAKYLMLDTNKYFDFEYDSEKDEVTLKGYDSSVDRYEIVIPTFVDKIDKSCFNGATYLHRVVCENPPKDCSGLFASLGGGCTRLDMTGFNVENVEDMHCMFCASTHLVDIDVSNWDTRNVKNMSYMFASNYHVYSLDLSSFKTPLVLNLDCFLYKCENLIEVDVSNMTAEKVVSMRESFARCFFLRRIKWGRFEPQQTLILYNTFDECPLLMKECKLFGA